MDVDELGQQLGPGQRGVTAQVHERVLVVERRHPSTAEGGLHTTCDQPVCAQVEVAAVPAESEEAPVQVHHDVAVVEGQLPHSHAPEAVPVAVAVGESCVADRFDGRLERSGGDEQVQVVVGTDSGRGAPAGRERRSLDHDPGHRRPVERVPEHVERPQGEQVPYRSGVGRGDELGRQRPVGAPHREGQRSVHPVRDGHRYQGPDLGVGPALQR